jgi:hypothetical protein
MAGLLPCNIRLNDESLRTLLCEAEAVINSRPITKVSEDPSDIAALTPNHLLLLCNHPAPPPGDYSESDLYRHRWRAIQHLSAQFWAKWTALYLHELQKRPKWLREKHSLAVGDLVLVSSENTPRGVWPMGLVVKVRISDDGLVRSAEVRLRSGAKVDRPIAKLVSLESH